MKLSFSGAAGSVTGSSHLLEVGGKKVLLDCGLYQGADARERGNDQFDFNPKELDALILSHAHIDHTGRLPMLTKLGFTGKIYATFPTQELCQIMLKDSAFIQESSAERENKWRARKNKELVEPLYTMADAEEALKLIEGIEFDESFEVLPGLRATFRVSGHMLGSSFVELEAKENSVTKKILFSGDVGNHSIPILREPQYVKEADVVILETTYGNRLHEEETLEKQRLLDLVNTTIENGGNVIIPSFAVGRTQELIYLFNEFAEQGLLNKEVKIVVDSPLAHSATKVFRDNTRYFDEDAQKLMASGDDVLNFSQLVLTESVEESKQLNATKSGLVVLSASGMADAGRILHHLKHNLWRKESTIIFVGYQAEGTTGAQILAKKPSVRIMGEDIVVSARVEQLAGLSGHADQAGLMEFVDALENKPQGIFLVHGDQDARATFGQLLKEKGHQVIEPEYGSSFDLLTMEQTEFGEERTVKKGAFLEPFHAEAEDQPRLDPKEKTKGTTVETTSESEDSEGNKPQEPKTNRNNQSPQNNSPRPKQEHPKQPKTENCNEKNQPRNGLTLKEELLNSMDNHKIHQMSKDELVQMLRSIIGKHD